MIARLTLAWQAWRFRAHRADYYEYLAVLMAHGDGRRTLLDILADDARRQPRSSPRGFLARYWVERYRAVGGDLAQTFARSLPAADLGLLRAAQLAGGEALTVGLRDLAATTRLLERARQGLRATLAAAAGAGAVALAMLLATPFYTVPALRHTFRVVPPEFWGGRTHALFGLADGLARWLPLWLFACLMLPLAASASLRWLTGPVRVWLDGRPPWSLYREFQAMRFLAQLAALVRPGNGLGLSLRDALLAQWAGAGRWKRWHLQRMVERADDGIVGAATFETGLLPREAQWFLDDMLTMHGLADGLARTRQRLEARWLEQLLARAARLRWALLIAALGVLLGLMFWHYAAIDELRRAMQSFYASQA